MSFFVNFALCNTLLFFVASAAVFTHQVIFIVNANKTTGTVIDVEKRESERAGNVLFRPVVAYFDATNTKHVFSSSFWHYPMKYEIDSSVPVAYYQNNAVICDFVSFWFLPLILFMVGLSTMLILIVAIYVKKCVLVGRFYVPCQMKVCRTSSSKTAHH